MELQKINTEIKTMSSKEISELTGKEHSNVMRDIRKLIDDLGELKFEFTSLDSIYIDSQNKERPMYILDKNSTLTLISGYSAILRMAIIKRWAELEEQNKPKELTRKELALMVIQAEEEKEQLLLQVDNLNTALDTLVEWVSILKVANFNKISEKEFKWQVLKSKSALMGFTIKKAESARYSYQNLYNVNVFKACYPQYRYNFI